MSRVVAWLTKRSGRMKGISEVIVVLTLILVAVVAVFAIRGWLAGQQSKMTNIDMATATYNVAYGSSGMIITLNVRNNLPNTLAVKNLTITLNNGVVLVASSSGSSLTSLTGTSTSPAVSGSSITPALASPSNQISAKSDGSFTITISFAGSPANVGIARITVQVQDLASGQSQVITAVGGG
jgi:predicted PurR-regulated permease PerM